MKGRGNGFFGRVKIGIFKNSKLHLGQEAFDRLFSLASEVSKRGLMRKNTRVADFRI